MASLYNAYYTALISINIPAEQAAIAADILARQAAGATLTQSEIDTLNSIQR